MAFKFKLEALLKKRKFEERLAKQYLGECQKFKNTLINKQKLQEEKLGKAIQNALQNIDLRFMDLQRHFIESCRNEIESCIYKLKEHESVMNDARQKLAAAKINLKTIEILKDKRWNEYKKEILKKENDMLEEIIIQRNGKNFNGF